jgi:hypothetical protein
VADLGYRLLQRQWCKGLASAGARELVRYGFDDVGLDRIIAQTLSVNAGSRAVMERAGLTYVRTFPTSVAVPAEGVEEGELEYELTREQWERLRRSSGAGARRPSLESQESSAVVPSIPAPQKPVCAWFRQRSPTSVRS